MGVGLLTRLHSEIGPIPPSHGLKWYPEIRWLIIFPIQTVINPVMGISPSHVSDLKMAHYHTLSRK